ncbi:MAG: STT3 domain-containing protein [archaeon]
MEIKEKVIERVRNVDRRQLFIVVLIFLLAFGVRGALMKHELFFEFDTYWHARVVSYILQGGGVPDRDPMAYYQLGGSEIGWKMAPVWWYSSALFYKIFTLNAPYDKELWIFFVKLIPAFWGACIAVAMFFLFKEMYGRKAGYVAGFFAAVVPAFVYRTMAGQFEDDALGFLWFVIGFYFFFKAVKEMEFNKESIKNAVISAIFFGLMAWTWEMFLLIPLVLVSYFVVTFILMWFKRVETAKLLNFAKIFVIVFVIFGVLATLKDDGRWVNTSIGYATKFIPMPGKDISIGEAGIFGQTVGEENVGYPYWGTKYNALIIFPLLALFLVPYRVLRKKQDHLSLFVFFWVIITLVMAYTKLKFTYTFGLPHAAAAGFIAVEAFEFMQKRTHSEKMIIGIAFGFMLLVGVASATFFMTQNTPNIEYDHTWKDGLKWLSENTPEGSKIFNWWDEGHWITFIGERKVIEDNRNIDLNADIDTARFVLEEDEEEAFKIVQKYDSDYILLGTDTLEKGGSMAIYAYQILDTSDPRLQKYFGTQLRCSKQLEGLTGKLFYQCGANNFNEEQMNAIPTTYSTTPNIPYSDRVWLFGYREKDNSAIYFLNAATNKTILARMWFDDPEIKHFKEVYGNVGVKIFKVIK